MALSLSASESPTSSGSDRAWRLPNSNPKPAPLPNGIKVPEPSQNGNINHRPNGQGHRSSSTLLEIPTAQTNTPSGRTPARGPKDKHELNLPTIRTEGPSPTSPFIYSGRGPIKEARRRRRKPWRKLMWVKQNFPDNYTDATFLESLQRNVNFRAYDFWSLVYDTTVIIQHLATVVVFVCAFIAISKDRVEPVYVAGTSTVLTVIGWLIWDEWNEEEQKSLATTQEAMHRLSESGSSVGGDGMPWDGGVEPQDPSCPVQIKLAKDMVEPISDHDDGMIPITRSVSISAPIMRRSQTGNLHTAISSSEASPDPIKFNSPRQPLIRSQTAPAYSSGINSTRPPSPPPPPSRINRRLSTLKSALLIYSTLLGLSPILKSLTRKTTSDSIWALSSWLFLVNLLCFDYGLGEGEADIMKKGADGGPQPPQGGAGNSVRKKYGLQIPANCKVMAVNLI
ncbi:hypothetical protein DRE_07199 [Drechslerella stenobrocha 248]|uniref:Uncharacterized protein n=1 Tax=Drechslerella stenobrocha 248 TaxID=1043628 RepID=W7HVR0_9PEZI|nr:hypothetical protein DRE_07199 [Drechslerella stenobrocha 248]